MSTVEDIRQALRAIYGTVNTRLLILRQSPSLTPMLAEFNALENALVSLKQKFINEYHEQISEAQRNELDTQTEGITERTAALAVPAGGGRKRKTRKNRKH
jgi:hypothetical protein